MKSDNLNIINYIYIYIYMHAPSSYYYEFHQEDIETNSDLVATICLQEPVDDPITFLTAALSLSYFFVKRQGIRRINSIQTTVLQYCIIMQNNSYNRRMGERPGP